MRNTLDAKLSVCFFRRGSYLAALVNVSQQIPQSLSLAWMLAWRDFQSRYVGSRAGYFWALLSPVLYASIFVILRNQLHGRGFQVNTGGIPAGLFALIGVAVFQVWYESLTNQVNHLRRGASLLRSLRIQPEVFFLSQLLLSFMDLGVRLAIIALAVLVFRVSISPDAWAAPPLAIMAVFTGNVLGYVLALIGSFYQDVTKFLQSISLGLLLGTPIFYASTNDATSTLHWIQIFNPLACTIAAARNALFGGEPGFLVPSLIWVGTALLAAALLLGVYRVVAPFVVERI